MAAHVDSQQMVTAHVERQGRSARIVVSGEVDLEAGDVLTTACGRVHPAHDHVVIDLRAVTFLDLAGFDQLLHLRDVLLASGCRTEFDTTGMAQLMLQVMEQAQLRGSPFHAAG